MRSDLFHVVDLDDPDEIEGAATALFGAGQDVNNAIGSVADSWSPLSEQYVAPESSAVTSAMLRPKSDGEELLEAMSSAQSALSQYASAIRDLESRRRSLLIEVSEFEEGAEDESDASEMADEVTGLQQRCARLAEDKDQAQNECRTLLNGITTGAGVERGSEHDVPTANEADDVPDLEEEGLPWTDGAAPVENALMGFGGAATVMRHHLSRGAPRVGWPPGPFQWAAGRGGPIGTVAQGILGWKPGGNGGQFLGKNDPRNPFRQPSGIRDHLRAGGQRFVANMTSKNRVPNPGKSDAHRGWSRAGNIASKGLGAPLTAVTSYSSSLKEDSAQRPDMGDAQKHVRAGTKAAGATTGAAAGAKTGAALGAAVGSFFPGPGTAIGAVAGGVAGAVAGSSIGEAAGDFLNNVTEGFWG